MFAFKLKLKLNIFTGNEAVTFYELNSIYGHDTFLLDLNGVGAGVKVSTVVSVKLQWSTLKTRTVTARKRLPRGKYVVPFFFLL